MEADSCDGRRNGVMPGAEWYYCSLETKVCLLGEQGEIAHER